MGERVLFLTSNGTGLGHLTRVMAISRRFEPKLEASILTLSAAAPVAVHEGFHVEYFPSHGAAAAEAPRRWDRRLRRRLETLLDELQPSLLVFDGAHPYDALVAVLRGARRAGLGTVWLRRPMWRPGVGAEGIYWSDDFDLVLEPGELAAAEDRGLTASRRDEVTAVAPIVYLDPDELLPREQAARELGLEPGRVNALVALGQGADLEQAVRRTLSLLANHPETQVVALESSLAPGLELPDGVLPLRTTYPVSRYHRAFDLAVAASGYNAFHELIANGVPSLFVPMPRQLDDQEARARWARKAGVGEGVTGPLDPELESRLGRLLDAGGRDEIRARIGELGFENGASRAARVLSEASTKARSSLREDADRGVSSARPSQTKPPRSGGWRPASAEEHPPSRDRQGSPGDAHPPSRGRWDRLAVSAQLVRRVGLRLPAIVARRALDRFRNPPPPPAKLVCPVLGLDGEELIATLKAKAEGAGLEPRRVLAITDSLNFAALRRAGFAFEYVPDEQRAAPVLERTGETYEAFGQRRINEATALRANATVHDPIESARP